MEEMTRKIMLAAVLGILLGVAAGYSPSVQPSAAPRAQLIMRPANQQNVAPPNLHPAYGPIPLLVALIAGLLIATPVFLISKRRNQS